MTTLKQRTSDLIAPAFYNVWRASDRYTTKVLKGGRNSGKSTTISLKIILHLMKHPVNALVVRKVGETLKDSVYEQLLEAIEILGVSEFWEKRVSPLSLRYKPTGTRIIFRGADKPEKIKSIKSSKHPIAVLWIEELAEFKTEDEVGVIVNSIIRAELPEGLNYSVFFSYNPPKRKQNWVNKKYNTQFQNKNVYVHHSDYRDNPFVSQAFIEEAEHVKETNEHKYKWVFLGEPIGGGVVPFNNLTFRRITDDEIKQYDNVRQGIDWGYAADPFAFTRWHYDKTRRKLYALDEHYGVKMSNAEAAAWIKAKGYDRDTIIADSAEPKSIDDLSARGISIAGAKKGPGSVESGEKWLDELEEIVIDPERTPNIAREFESIDYQIDKDGEVRSKLEDKDNHTIDACRYAVENDIGRGIDEYDAKLYVGFGGAEEREDDLW